MAKIIKGVLGGLALGLTLIVALYAMIGNGSNDIKTKLDSIGGTARLSMPSPGCMSEDATSKIGSLFRENDPLAAKKYAIKAGCAIGEEGKIGKVEHVSILSGTTCLRFPGEPDCRWFLSGFVEPVSK